jgi:hypothetical protein
MMIDIANIDVARVIYPDGNTTPLKPSSREEL